MRQLIISFFVFLQGWTAIADENPKKERKYQEWRKKYFDENGNDKRRSLFRKASKNRISITFAPTVHDRYCSELAGVLNNNAHCAPSHGDISLNVFDFNESSDSANFAKSAWIQYQKQFLLLMKSYPIEASKAPSGWHSDDNEICIEREYLPSNILRRPYFEDATYCARWSQEAHSRFGGMHHIESSAWVTLRVIVSVTQNPNSPYRQPNQQESARYGDAISSAYWKILEATCKELGWEFDFAQNGRVRSCRAVVNTLKK